jgi:hypothetical protein
VRWKDRANGCYCDIAGCAHVGLEQEREGDEKEGSTWNEGSQMKTRLSLER